MNRIILIGNGFDLAHGLPTRYEDFINWYWDQWLVKLLTCHTRSQTDGLCTFSIKIDHYTWQRALWDKGYAYNRPKGNDFISIIKTESQYFRIEYSPFLQRICKSLEEKKWVDIEQEYYELLRNALLHHEECDYSLFDLNAQLFCLQKLLTEYLTTISSAEITINSNTQKLIFSPIRKNDVCISQLSAYYNYIGHLINHENDYKRILCRRGIEDYYISCMVEDLKHLKKQFQETSEIEDVYLRDLILPENILILNFNYTNLADKYVTCKTAEVNHIHGSLDAPQNMIFGYGDELDYDYNELLRQIDNEYLKNIKSIKYLETNNYRNLLQFIESAPYQIFIMGHSCGNSDRTLLNTLFEHKNCVSIKPYYYQKKDGSDNYLEIVQNICRNFTDMKLMRDRVVNKTFCEPLPQCTQKN